MIATEEQREQILAAYQAAEADRDRLQADLDDAIRVGEQVAEDARKLADERSRYRNALERIANEATFNPAYEAANLALAALAAPDTPPDA